MVGWLDGWMDEKTSYRRCTMAKQCDAMGP